MAMVQKHIVIGKINQIQFYGELQRMVMNIYNDLTIWTTKLFREMLGKCSAAYSYLKRYVPIKTYSKLNSTSSKRRVDGTILPGLPTL